LVESGDEVLEIEAVISGSISYIFNNYAAGKPFRSLIQEARELGYTEPDPRDDLSGQDIKRKIVILSRVAGYPLEPEEVDVDAILPDSCMAAKDIDSFFEELDRHEHHFQTLLSDAQKNNARLRYIAKLVNGQASVRLEQVTADSPFYNLASTDNMIVFRTSRYRSRPMVIQGPGAGSHVTAAGVFAEIIQLGNIIV
jgi:aspartokinase/homoserine dehydrogenase 1